MTAFKGIIRSVTKQDLGAVEKILSAWLTNEETEHYLGFIKNSIDKSKESLQFDSNYLIAETKDKEVIGILGYRKPIPKMMPFAQTQNPAELNMLYVLPKKRGGQGVGTALVKEMENILNQKEYTEIIIRSAKKFETSGWGFYDQLPGFKRIAILNEENSEEAQIWNKILTK